MRFDDDVKKEVPKEEEKVKEDTRPIDQSNNGFIGGPKYNTGPREKP